MTNNTSSKDYGLESQRTIRYRPTKMTFREYDQKIMNCRPGLKYWHLVLDNYHEREKQKPLLDSRELKMTDRIAMSKYVQGNGPERKQHMK
jgi:hypothetical protein